MEDSDLVLGAMVTLQDVIESRAAYAATAGILPAACRAHSASRMVRGMATLGGEAVHGAHDSEVVAALLALNTVFVVRHSGGPVEIPGLRFLKDARADLVGGASWSRSSSPARRRGRRWSAWPSFPRRPRSCPWRWRSPSRATIARGRASRSPA
jgi:xanthine dehydrogenase iron-sulfur cluster and FAD-binding subunit A